MSSTAASVEARVGERRGKDPLVFRVVSWIVIAATLGIFAAGFEAGRVREQLSWELLPWVALGIVVSLVPVRVGRLSLDMDFPLFLAAGFIYGPVVGGLLIFLSAFDPRKLRREISLTLDLANRAQVSLSVMAGAWVFASLGGHVGEWPWVLVAGFAALTVDATVNYLFAVGLTWLRTESSPREISRSVPLGGPGGFFVEYAGYGFAGILLAEAFVRIGPWSLVAFAVPLYLAREAFSRRQRLEEQGRALRVGREELAQTTERIAEERQEERLGIAASLHDDVLQSLHYLTLNAQVVREDLRNGRLLELDQDVPILVEAAQETAVLARAVISDLRESPLGRRGLGSALHALIAELQETTSARIEACIDEVESSAAHQLLVYQVAREALRNAVEHSGASRITVQLRETGGRTELLVTDDGRGFDPASVDAEQHFGLELMKERVRAAGGEISLESGPDLSTRIRARFPIPLGRG